MQIQVNLLPGGKKKGRASKGAALNVGAAFAGLSDKVRDPLMLGSVGAVALSVLVVGALFTTQQANASEIAERLESAVSDSTRLTTVLEARRVVKAESDSVNRQVQIIRTIDDNRYVWAHLLDEISTALPQYTWLTSVEQTSQAKLPAGAQAPEPAAAGRSAATKAAKENEAEEAQDSIVIHQPIEFKVIGQTVDMQALTTFMKDLESSPFVKSVMLVKSEIVVVDGKDITEFQLNAEYEVAPMSTLRTESLVVPVR